MPPTPVIFDLFGTLVPAGTRAQRDAVSHAMALDLGVDAELLAAAIRDTFDLRTRGLLGDLETTVRHLAERSGAEPSDAAVRRAAERRLGMTAELLSATWALDVLDELLHGGHPMALVSDCSAETVAVWPRTDMAARIPVAVFSCVLGRRKPDPQTYLAATATLGVAPEECIFVGDGGSGELTGAQRQGMRAILLDHGGHEGVDRPDQEVDWTGERLSRLSDLPGLLRAGVPLSGSS